MSSTILKSKFLLWLFIFVGIIGLLITPFSRVVLKQSFYELGLYDVLSLGVGLLQAFIYALTLLAISYQIETEYGKNKKNQTIHAMTEFLEFKYGLNGGLILADRLSSDELKKLVGDRELNEEERDIKKTITRLLDRCEHLSVCVESDLYDLEFVNKVSGSLLVTIYTKFLPYIQQVRAARKNDDIYSQFESVHAKLRVLRSQAKR